MRSILAIFEQSIKERPHEWLWTHNRWKQQLPGRLKKTFRHDAVCLIFPNNPELIRSFSKVREIYPTEFLTVYVPEKVEAALGTDIEIKRYRSIEDILITDYRFKLVLDFTQDKRIKTHFKSLSAFYVLHLNSFEELCQATGFTLMPT